MVERHHLQPARAVHGRQPTRNNDPYPFADADPDDRCSDDDDQRGSDNVSFRLADDDGDQRGSNNDSHRLANNDHASAGSEWILAKLASRKDLRQHVIAERTGHRPYRCNCCSRR